MEKRPIIAHLTIAETEAIQEAIVQRLTRLYKEESKESLVDLYEEVKDSIRALDEIGSMFSSGWLKSEYEDLTGVEIKEDE